MKAEHVKNFLLRNNETENQFEIIFANEIDGLEITVNSNLGILVVDEKTIDIVEFVFDKKEDRYDRYYYLIDTTYIVSIHIA